MKKSTKIVAVIMAFICFLNLKHTVLAEEIAQRIGGAYISDETYVDSNDSIEFSRIKENEATGVQPRAGMQMLSSSITRYEQEDPYYCVPACMQTILAYNNGTTPPTQDLIAANLGFIPEFGVDFLRVKDYLNDNQTKREYVMHTKSNQTAMIDRINADITSYGVPSMIRIEVSDSSQWFYTTNGHALVCAGVNSNLSSVYLIDPLVNYTAYIKSTYDLYNVFTHLAW